MNEARLIALIDELRALPHETEWVEFKVDYSDPEVIGKRISALSNGARLRDKSAGYLIYGVQNETHAVVGTAFKGESGTAKGQPLAFWLSQRLNPFPVVTFAEVNHPDGRLVLIEIPAATGTPTKFGNIAYIRVGEATPKLSDYPNLEKQLWARLQSYAWERDVAQEYVPTDNVLTLLDYQNFLPMLGSPIPSTGARVVELLAREGLVAPDVGGRWNILNLGACLLARDIHAFPRLARKAIRLIQYRDTSRLHAISEQLMGRGYAISFEHLIDTIMSLTAVESIGALRATAHPFPRPAVRELVANCLIHQDMTVTGAGPMIEIFRDRIEVTNPGQSLVEPKRFIDMPPKSRNEAFGGHNAPDAHL
jgi:predicted HTH transcriptional regulator